MNNNRTLKEFKFKNYNEKNYQIVKLMINIDKKNLRFKLFYPKNHLNRRKII